MLCHNDGDKATTKVTLVDSVGRRSPDQPGIATSADKHSVGLG